MSVTFTHNGKYKVSTLTTKLKNLVLTIISVLTLYIVIIR